MTTMRGIGALIAAAVIIGPSGGMAWAAPNKAVEASVEDEGVGAPQTPEEHFARAASYREKAASYRAEAETHRKMLADYEKRRGVPDLKTKTGRESSWIAKMREHCEGYIKAAERLAAEADRFAEFHRMRGEEMKGE